MRNHAAALTRKAYWTQFENSPDFVIMFIPGEHFLAAAMERDRELLQWAFDRNVVIASTINLLGLARTMAWIWRQTALADDAKKVEELGRAMHDRLAVAAGHLRKMGGGLSSAVNNYNSFVGSFEHAVLREGRKFKELSVGSSKEIEEVGPVEISVRGATLDVPQLLGQDADNSEAAE
jgi:DNA recombination protein RmuC